MYIGGTGSEGLIHLVWELIDNGVDEAAGGHANKIEVVFHRDKSIEVIDNGRGIPIGKHPKHKVSALEVVLTELHAGGKFGGGAYGASGGLHGVGASVVNGLSSKLVAEDQKAGHFTGGRFKASHDLEKVKKISKTKTGSRIRFWPDMDIFDPDATIDYATVRDRIARATFLVPGLKIKLVDKRTGSKQEEEFLSRGGLKDLVEYESIGMPAKLADCRKHGINSELLVVEGDSAAGPAMAGRDSATMAILPLRGKVVNAAKATVKQVLDNSEAQALFTSVGAGSGDAFDLDSARYGRIVILCDADVDGSHIRCLLLTLMHKYMRPMLEAGRIYAAQPPLFTTKVNGENYRAFSDEEKESITAELTKGNRKAENIRWQRFKGLGEMNVDELASAALDPETRILKRLTMHDGEQAKAAAKMFDVLMGSNVEARRDYIVKETALFDREALDV
ncbi:UNVERIFIED_CONTAM: hypothetical protein GTU68_063583 [Idotea baltica]|nr:hypothetical protein [Idotea baltica]